MEKTTGALENFSQKIFNYSDLGINIPKKKAKIVC